MAVAASKYPEILWRRSGSTIERNSFHNTAQQPHDNRQQQQPQHQHQQQQQCIMLSYKVMSHTSSTTAKWVSSLLFHKTKTCLTTAISFNSLAH
jgi:hypothetical protein